MGIMTYKPSPDDPILVFKNGGFGYNPLNKESEKQIIEKIKALSKLDMNMKPKEKKNKEK